MEHKCVLTFSEPVMDLFQVNGISFLSKEEFLTKLANAQLTKDEAEQLDIQIVSIDDRFIDNQSIHLNIEGELFSINTHGSIHPLNIVKVEDVVYGLHCGNCQSYGYHNSDIPYFPHLYKQKNLFKKIMSFFPNCKYTVIENHIRHEKRYKIRFALSD